MIPPFRVWDADADANEDAEDSIEIIAGCAGEAAEIFAERQYEGGDPFEHLDVRVSGADFDVCEFRVEVDFTPNFYATQGVRSG